jgi:hypothetical protein
MTAYFATITHAVGVLPATIFHAAISPLNSLILAAFISINPSAW